MTPQRVIFLRIKEVKRRVGKAHTATYGDVRTGLLPPPIPLGPRAKGFIEYEIDSVTAARAAGQSDAQIRQLVAELVAARQELVAS